MSDTPLNEQAVENATDTVWMNLNGEYGVDSADRRKDDYATLEAIMSVAIRDYLAETTPAVVEDFTPQALNIKGWTCGCEPGNYDTCDECQSACDELSNFLHRIGSGQMTVLGLPGST